eukprot:1534668-Pyramimonas_sp.AAC.1
MKGRLCRLMSVYVSSTNLPSNLIRERYAYDEHCMPGVRRSPFFVRRITRGVAGRLALISSLCLVETNIVNILSQQVRAGTGAGALHDWRVTIDFCGHCISDEASRLAVFTVFDVGA